MSDKSSIEWTDATWNPIRGTKGRHHCVRISEGCKNCYAATMNHRFKGPDYVKGADTPRLDEDALLEPLRWKRPRRIFVCSMTDLFMDEHTDEMIGRVWGMMEQAEQHTFQVLTKRAKRMQEWLSNFPAHMTLPNVWLGVSAENQERADERIPHLLQTPAAVRFVSAEPLLGPINLDNGECSWLSCRSKVTAEAYETMSVKQQEDHHCCESFDAHGNHYRGIDWVIVGGESGPGARPCDVSWIRSIKEQCQGAGVPVFVKQLGARPFEGRGDETPHTCDHGNCPLGALHLKNEKGKRDPKGGWMMSWPEDLRVRQMPEVRA